MKCKADVFKINMAPEAIQRMGQGNSLVIGSLIFASGTVRDKKNNANNLKTKVGCCFFGSAQPFNNFYQTCDDGHLSVSGLEPDFWQYQCRALGCEDLSPTCIAIKVTQNKKIFII